MGVGVGVDKKSGYQQLRTRPRELTAVDPESVDRSWSLKVKEGGLYEELKRWLHLKPIRLLVTWMRTN